MCEINACISQLAMFMNVRVHRCVLVRPSVDRQHYHVYLESRFFQRVLLNQLLEKQNKQKGVIVGYPTGLTQASTSLSDFNLGIGGPLRCVFIVY